MSVNVIAHDTRLEGRTPATTSSTVTFEVGPDTSLQHFFDRCREIDAHYNGIRTLSIMAHGVELSFCGTVAGGYGVMFCREYLLLDNAERFALLARRVQHIDLLVCSAAMVSPDINHADMEHPENAGVWSGDGNEMCRQIAIHAQCTLTAATEIQAYTPYREAGPPVFGYSLYTIGDMDFGEWEGLVITYDHNGNITHRQPNPSAWRTADGVVHDPRLETRVP